MTEMKAIIEQTFDLGTVLSITTGKLLADLGNVYEILNWMTGDELFTHQLPRASKECAPYLLEKFPVLSTVDTSLVTPKIWETWLSDQKAIYGNEFHVPPIPNKAHEVRNPITELCEIVGEERVIVVKYN